MKKPNIIDIVPKADSLEVTWVKPISDEEIKQYEVCYEYIVTHDADTMVKLTGLERETEYTVTVRRVYSYCSTTYNGRRSGEFISLVC